MAATIAPAPRPPLRAAGRRWRRFPCDGRFAPPIGAGRSAGCYLFQTGPGAAIWLLRRGADMTRRMGILDRLEEIFAAARKRTLGALLDVLAAQKMRRDEAAFSIALIALSAKMAKADGVVTDEEISAFSDYFQFPPEEADRVRMLYQLAQQDVAGFDEYLKRVRRIFEDDPMVLEDVLDCLFHVAAADGVAHPGELVLLERAAEIFSLPKAAYRRLKAIHLGLGADDPFLVLGLEPDADLVAAKAAYRALVRENHPDALIARGVPVDMIKVGEARMAAINAAYEQLLTELA